MAKSKKREVRKMKDEFTRQEEYVAKRKAISEHFGMIVAEAFIRGMRDLGYKDLGTIMDEFIDNAAQSNATVVECVFGYAGSRDKPEQIAIVDDGHGMSGDMLRLAVMWGGTHREDGRDTNGVRTGFGRYGYGLPSAAVSVAKRYTVYSKAKGGEWQAVTIDLEELAAQAEKEGNVEVPAYRKEKPPAFINASTQKCNPGKMPHGTIIVLEDLDRLPAGWQKPAVIKKKLLNHFGLVYRHLLPAPRMYVEGEEVLPVDPLFLMENGRFYDENTIMAEAVKMKDFQVEAPSGETGMVRIRASWLPANFQAVDPKENPAKSKKNSRFSVMKATNGLLFCRDGRQIDCVSASAMGATFQNYDRNIKIEIDFDPELDEFFGVATSKQQITVAEGMWSRLQAAGLTELIADLRKLFMESSTDLAAEIETLADKETGVRPSEVAMTESAKLNPSPVKPSPKKVAKARKKLEDQATALAETTGRPKQEILDKIKKETEEKPHKVEFKKVPEGPFYRTDRAGKQKQLIINTDHRFYSEVYEAPEATPATRHALEVLLFVLADAELDAIGEFEEFYVTARNNWSMRLKNALQKLNADDSLADKRAAIAEDFEFQVSQEELEEEVGSEAVS